MWPMLRFLHSGKGTHRFRQVAAITTLTLALAALPTGARSRPRDMNEIKQSFAARDILTLYEKKIATGYRDGTWRPEQPVRRSEFASMLSRAFDLPAPKEKDRPRLEDVRGNWAESSIAKVVASGLMEVDQNRFHPDRSLTRGEAVRAIAKVLEVLQGDEVWTTSWSSPFSDANTGANTGGSSFDNDTYRAAEIVRRLGILPRTFAGDFSPERVVSRAEAAALVNGALKLETTSGQLVRASQATQEIVVTLEGNERTVPVSTEAVVVRNGVETSLDSLQAGDTVRIVRDLLGEAAIVRAKGVITRQELISRASGLSRGVLSPAEIEALLSGDRSQKTQALWSAAYDALLRQGLTPLEADALLNQDWSALRGQAAERLVKALSDSLQVSPDLVRAVLEKNRAKIVDEARLEVLSRLLSGELDRLLSRASSLMPPGSSRIAGTWLGK